MAHQLWASRFYKVGGSCSFVIPKEVQRLLGLVPGDLLVLTVYEHILMARKVTKNLIAKPEEIATDAVPKAFKE